MAVEILPRFALADIEISGPEFAFAIPAVIGHPEKVIEAAVG